MGCQKEEKSAVNSLKINFQEGDLPSIHPHDLMIYLRGISIAKHLFEGLTRVDAQGKAVLAGAKSVDVSPDGLHYTFVLRDNKWSDGSPVTALHYEAAWKEALSPQSSCSRAHLLYPLKNGEAAKKGTVPLSDIGVKALNDKTLSIDLANPCPYFIELLSLPICMPLFNAKEKQPTRFNGPFQMGQWVRNHSIRLDQNPHFWNLKKVSLKEIDIFMVQDTPTAFTLFEKKKMDWIGLPLCPLSTEMVDHLKRSGALNSHPIDRAFWLFLNTKHPGLASSSIRKALSLAIDRSQITQHILIGGEPLSKPLPENLLSAPAVSQENRLRENMAEASHCFEQGLKELGFTKETFPPLVITYSQQANRKQFAEYIQQAWTKGLGIQVQLEPQEWNLLRTNLEKGQYMVSGCFEAAYYKDPMEILERLATLNPSNFSQWTHPLFGAKIASAIDEKNTQRRNALMGEAEAILAEHMPFIPICSDRFLFAHTPNLKGYAFDYVGAIDFSYASFKTQE
jgi:oligopeptide transport system substrate-binding protein